ncbi:MAG TPA: glycosyltransferase family 2 protein [Vicinamibacterales bacterium]
MPGNVSIVIPTWNGRHLLERFLPSVEDSARAYRKTSGADVEIVVVDDGSTDDSVEWLAGRARTSDVPIRVVALDRNGGFGVACNRGVEAARNPLVLLLNNDVALDPGAIAPLVRQFDRADASPSLFAAHCRVVDFDTNAVSGRGQLGQFRRGFIRIHEPYDPDGSEADFSPSMFASGGTSMFDRTRFLELGGFDPLFAPFYYEDVELSYRAWKRGLAVTYVPESLARHRFSSTIGLQAQRRIRRISQRNRLFLHWIHLHDMPWLARHVMWVTLLFITAPITLRFDFMRSVAAALRHLPEVRARRRKERSLARRTDRDLIGLFDARADTSDKSDTRQKKRPA